MSTNLSNLYSHPFFWVRDLVETLRWVLLLGKVYVPKTEVGGRVPHAWTSTGVTVSDVASTEAPRKMETRKEIRKLKKRVTVILV